MKKLLTILAGVAMVASLASAQELANFSMGRGQRIVSPEVKGDSVTFRLSAPNASQVKLYGNWMGYTDQVDCHRNANGVWEAKIQAPYPEIYTYNFIVDGVNVNDPQNFMVQRDGTRFLNMLFVPGARSYNYYEANKRGTVKNVWYHSDQLGADRRMVVYFPYEYEKNPKKNYPVLYLLHGGGGDEEAWSSMGRAAQILDNLIEQGHAVPMIVVMPNGNPGQQAAPTLGLPTKTITTPNAYVKSLVEEIIPFVEKEFRAIPNADSRAIAGLSMGGGHTTSATILYPGTFSYICPMSCGIQESDHLDADLQGIKKAGYKLYWIGCGTGDFAWKGTTVLDAALTRNGMEHTLFTSDGGHEWKNWRLFLNSFAQLLFK